MTLKRNLLLAVISVLVAGLVVVACQPGAGSRRPAAPAPECRQRIRDAAARRH